MSQSVIEQRMLEVSERLLRARLGAGLSTAQASRLSGVPRRQIEYLERAAVVPTWEDVRALARAYGVSAKWVMWGQRKGGER